MGQLQSPSLVLFPVLGFCCGALSPSHHWLISEGWNKNAACPSCMVHVQSLKNFYQNEAILFKWRVRDEEVGFGVEEKGMLHLFPDLLGLWPLFPRSLRLCLAGRLEALAHIAFFSHWVQQWRRVFGDFFSPRCSKFSGKYNWYLPPKLFQSPITYVATLSRAQNACI